MGTRRTSFESFICEMKSLQRWDSSVHKYKKQQIPWISLLANRSNVSSFKSIHQHYNQPTPASSSAIVDMRLELAMRM